MNYNIFKCIDNQEKAYWLGFLYADGCNLPDYNRFVVHLSIKDLDHIIKFSRFLDINELKIKTYPPGIKYIGKRKIKDNGSCRLTCYSKEVSHQLLNLGMVKAKSKILKFPNTNMVPSNLINHFLRGYFDGDGCLRKTENKNVVRFGVIILSSKEFCKKAIDIISNILNINVTYWKSYEKKNIKAFSISGNNQVLKFMNWIYKDSKIHLNRKYIIYNKLKEEKNKIAINILNKSSRYNNIFYDKNRLKWTANIRYNKKTKMIGRYNTEEKAFIEQQKYINQKIV
jgi:hypothetical protein